jgi:hypothetical protein
MKYNLNVTVKKTDGTDFMDANGKPDTLLNVCKVVLSTPMQDDPKTLEHLNKSLRIYQKIDDSVDGEVELKKESMVFIRDRMIKMGLPYLPIFAFNNLFEDPVTQAQLDDV